MDDIAPDGSPVAVYLALPAAVDIARIRSVLPTGASVLDLGSGPGRIAAPLVAAGHTVTAVDDSPAMLAHVIGAETVLGDVWSLGDTSWTQHFVAAIVDDTELASLAAASDLAVLRTLDADGAWVLLGAGRLGAV